MSLQPIDPTQNFNTTIRNLGKCSINSPVFNSSQGSFYRMDVVDGKQTGNSQGARLTGNQTSHPVVAVDQVGFDRGNPGEHL